MEKVLLFVVLMILSVTANAGQVCISMSELGSMLQQYRQQTNATEQQAIALVEAQPEQGTIGSTKVVIDIVYNQVTKDASPAEAGERVYAICQMAGY